MNMHQYIVVLSTVPDSETGEKIAKKILENRLAACVTLSAASKSLYWWNNQITQDKEHILIIKTREKLYPELEEKIKKFHPYDTPEIIGIPIAMGSESYLRWIDNETKDVTP
jgi:periplasmic divalent cation tolerance protein